MENYGRDFRDDRGGGGGARRTGGTRVYVGGLDAGIKKEDIEVEFEKFGNLNSVWVAYNPPGFAFVEFADRRDAETACKNMNNAELLGAQLRVEISRGRGGRGRFPLGGRGRDREGGEGRGGFRGSWDGGMRGRGERGRGGGFRGRGGFDRGGDSYRSREPPTSRGYALNGYPPRDGPPIREPRFRSRSPHRFSGAPEGRREFLGDSYGGRPGGYQRNSYQSSAPF